MVDERGTLATPYGTAFYGAARAPSRALYERLKPGLLDRAMSPLRRRAEANVIGGFLLIGWGGDSPEQLITSAELRNILVESDDDFEVQILWQLERWSAEKEGRWRTRLSLFLTEVWPNHRALRTPEMSTHLVDLALTSGDLFPQIVQAILPRLVPVRGGFLRGLALLIRKLKDIPRASILPRCSTFFGRR